MARESQLKLLLGSIGNTVTVEAVSTHPNKMRLKGVLVRLDEASTKAPNGADGHRILVPTDVAKQKVSTLIGMGLNYADDLTGHAQRHKVGVIDKAWIDGKDLRVEGTVWKHDFPEAEKKLKQKGLGMSMEIGEVHVEDTDADVWTLTDFCFLGATVLWKDHAAYYRTEAIAANADRGRQKVKQTATVEKPKVKKPVDLQKVVSIAAKAATQDLGQTIVSAINAQTEMIASMAAKLEANTAALSGITANVDEEDDEINAEMDEEVDDMTTKKKKGTQEACGEDMKVKAKSEDDEEDEPEEDDEDDEMESMATGVDKGDLEELGSKLEEDAENDDDPGHMNQGAKNKGNKTTSENKVGKTVSSAAIQELRSQVAKLAAGLQASRKENQILRKKLSKVGDQVTASAAQINRRSLPPEYLGLLAKANLDPVDLRASGQQLSPADVDAVLASANIQLDTVKRIEIKNAFRNAGIMSEGKVERGIGLNGR